MLILSRFIGSLLAIYVLAWIFEKLLFQRVLDDPLKGKVFSVAAAWFTAGSIAGFGFADGGPFYWPAYLIYWPAALIIGGLAWRRGLQLRRENAEGTEAIAETFG